MIDHLLLGLLRATEAAAIAASKWVGTGDKLSADQAASEAMRARLNQIHFAATIKIGEGKKDHSAGLFRDERFGMLSDKSQVMQHDLAVDPIDGTTPTVTSGPEAMSVLAVAEEGALFSTEAFYMQKIAYGPQVARETELTFEDSLETVIQKICTATRKDPPKVMVCILDRPRHETIIKTLRSLGVRIKLIRDCDISGAIATCLPDSGIDLLYGIGGAPEAVLTACAMRCLQGGFKARLVDPSGKILDKKIYDMEDLAKGPCAFAATGVTDGSLLQGVRFTDRGPVTNSVLMRSESGTIRWVTAHHGPYQ
ncbi:MAG: fructose-bisphosphatase class II [Candidatus Omnitrophica bacterium CG11_big_fil_rev_8_21_14_0_20_45_26]|uniref:Fructose-1,6-bisphosphatase n=1 Tax=Candidatus Abzuiibacterium crystallinum TaxID=1974748 RepID=A0A2H0LNI4_9BACT|nr:MAG: fructose-bisphosphatase class II [Candidatus Omnitrophica bacterium CG11_big_fil_rev_8_21_14_0_20_45_26]PIW63451.1 MAG: fructose-bisphosphatase class II [Candidatus Omnitrophica bacterium CG12_big_fil_rev_8_21_14_0_65_45_16]